VEPFIDLSSPRPEPQRLTCLWIRGVDGRLECRWVPESEHGWDEAFEQTPEPARRAG